MGLSGQEEQEAFQEHSTLLQTRLKRLIALAVGAVGEQRESQGAEDTKQLQESIINGKTVTALVGAAVGEQGVLKRKQPGIPETMQTEHGCKKKVQIMPKVMTLLAYAAVGQHGGSQGAFRTEHCKEVQIMPEVMTHLADAAVGQKGHSQGAFETGDTNKRSTNNAKAVTHLAGAAI